MRNEGMRRPFACLKIVMRETDSTCAWRDAPVRFGGLQSINWTRHRGAQNLAVTRAMSDINDHIGIVLGDRSRGVVPFSASLCQGESKFSHVFSRGVSDVRSPVDGLNKLVVRHVAMHMTSATIKLFLPRGDAKSLRTAEISNWSGKAIAAPRTELDELLAREELDKAGIYILIGNDPQTNASRAYVGEAEVIRERLKQHKTKEFWVSAIVFVSKDENLTKAHVRYLENRLLAEAAQINRFTLDQNQSSGSKLPESDREDMEVFLAHIRQLLPVLGSDILAPIAQPAAKGPPGGVLFCRIKDAEARGQRTANGFVVYQGSTAVSEERPSAESYPYVVAQRKQLIANRTLINKDGLLVFTKDAEFSSPSAAAAVIHGGSANGLIAWKTENGTSLKQLDEQA